ncbi:MAG: undecaprenyldiphospho-muramoylpentapeptide beta-N-acetylglucosaminyltransferase [Atopobiaceae bacterium]
MSESLNVAIAAGGTAGHINPALALAEELKHRGHRVIFIGQKTKLEGTLVPEAGFDFKSITVTGIDRARPWTALTALINMHKAEQDLDAYFSGHGRPDVAVGFGAYVEMPLLRWCTKHKIPYVIHEQNSVPGLANKTEAAHAASVCVSLPVATKVFKEHIGPQTAVVVTGNPVRQSVIQASRARGRASFGIPEDATMLLVFGGSLGARHINEAVVALQEKLLSRPNLYVVHSTGKDLVDEVVAALPHAGVKNVRWQVLPYIENMGEALAAADVVVSRAGASSIAEIAALSVPSLLVPYPLATENHQTTNAHYLVDAGAAVLVPDDEVETNTFSAQLFNILDNPDVRQKMVEAAKGLGQDRAASAVADQVESAATLGEMAPKSRN